jgi:DNA-binding PadR family transcriptional regulator
MKSMEFTVECVTKGQLLRKLTYILIRYTVMCHMARKPRTGPAADPELLILSSLASGPKHGYAMMSDIEAFAGVALGAGTLYTAISRLVDKKLIAPQTSAGRQRPYALTAQGETALTEQLRDMRRVATVGLRRLRPA